jgi:hypothetical protein
MSNAILKPRKDDPVVVGMMKLESSHFLPAVVSSSFFWLISFS